MTQTRLPDKYIIRVYALILDPSGEYVLLSDEFQMGMKMIKFPGGGLKFGEGTLDCLQREAAEELGQELIDIHHFYTTDFYQKARFYQDAQLISIYYLARPSDPETLDISEKAFDFPEGVEGSRSFRWYPVGEVAHENLTFPIDRKAAELLQRKMKENRE